MRDTRSLVGQPILAAAGFEPAPANCEDSRPGRKSRLKGGCRQDCLPHVQQLLLFAFLVLALPLCAGQSGTEQGINAFQQGRYVEACHLLEDAIGRDPTDEHARAFLALARAAGGHCVPAIEELTARFHSSSNPDLARLAGLALVQCMSTAGDTDKALAVATRLEAKYPDDADVLYQAARLHMKAFNDVTRHMFEKTPASYRVNQLSAEIFEMQNRFTEAAGEYT